MDYFEPGTVLKVDGVDAQVIGYIVYKNPDDCDKSWVDYRLISEGKELWLSWDDEYQEYSISWPTYLEDGRIDGKWHKVDEGRQIVIFCEGNIDVEIGDTATFIEYEDSTEEETLSIEMWSDGTEISEGCYLDQKEIEYQGVKEIYMHLKVKWWNYLVLALFPMILLGIFGIITFLNRPPTIQEYLRSESIFYNYVTSVTGNNNHKANIYEYDRSYEDKNLDEVAKDIIQGIRGNTELVTANHPSMKDGSISILTKKEYCLLYYPKDKKKTVYIQVSNRKYNYTSDNDLYQGQKSTNNWYHSHYYSSAFSADAVKWRNYPSAYKMYHGPIIQDLGNGYYDTYAQNVRNSSIGSRDSDEGGIGRGK